MKKQYISFIENGFMLALIFTFLMSLTTITLYGDDFQKTLENAKSGDSSAQFALAYDYYENGKEGIRKDKVKAAKWYYKAAVQGHAAAQNNLGKCYYDGEGVLEDREEAFSWFQKAANQGDKVGQCNVALCYEIGEGVVQNKTEAYKWYRKSAENGYAKAQCWMGDYYCKEKKVYHYGLGSKEDEDELLKWYNMAAEQGYVEAEYKLGSWYNDKIYIFRDPELNLKYNGRIDVTDKSKVDEINRNNLYFAKKWLRKAAVKGHIKAQKDLGFIYYNREDNCTEASKWYLKAAEQKDAEAQCYLGKIYYEQGNRNEGMKWLRRAANQGDEDARDYLHDILTSDD